MIIIGRNGGVRFAVRRKREPQRFFGAGFANRAGDSNDFRVQARARRARKIAQRLKHIGNDQTAAHPESVALAARDHGEPGAGLQRAIDEFMPIAVLALNGEERIAFADRAAIDGNAGNVRRARSPTRSACIASPWRQWSRARSCHFALQGRRYRFMVGETAQRDRR